MMIIAAGAISGLSNVLRVINMGTVFAVEVVTAQRGYDSCATEDLVRRLKDRGVLVRPLGNVLYLMCSLNTDAATCERVLLTLKQELLLMKQK